MASDCFPFLWIYLVRSLLKTQQRTLVPHKTFNWPLNCKFTRLHQRFTAWSCNRAVEDAGSWTLDGGVCCWGEVGNNGCRIFQLLGPNGTDGQMFLVYAGGLHLAFIAPPARVMETPNLKPTPSPSSRLQARICVPVWISQEQLHLAPRLFVVCPGSTLSRQTQIQIQIQIVLNVSPWRTTILAGNKFANCWLALTLITLLSVKYNNLDVLCTLFKNSVWRWQNGLGLERYKIPILIVSLEYL